MLKRCLFSYCHKYYRLIYFIVLLLFVSASFQESAAQKQRSETPPLKERIFFGTGLGGLQFGTITNIDVSPVVGIWLLPRLNIAVGPKYEYYKYYEEKAQFYGGRVYSQFVFIKDIDKALPLGIHLGFFLHAEDEFFRLDYTDGTDWMTPFVNTPLVGAGISEPLGMKAAMNFMVLWPLENYYGLYSEPEFRISFTF